MEGVILLTYAAQCSRRFGIGNIRQLSVAIARRASAAEQATLAGGRHLFKSARHGGIGSSNDSESAHKQRRLGLVRSD